MHVVLFLLFGLIVGALARFLVPGPTPGGWLTSIVIGIAGSFVGGFLGRALSLYRDGEPAGFVMSLIGAIVVTVVYHTLLRRSTYA